MRYRVELYPSEEGLAVSVPSLPGCWSQGATEDEALDHIKNAIGDYLSVIDERSRGDDIRDVEVFVKPC